MKSMIVVCQLFFIHFRLLELDLLMRSLLVDNIIFKTFALPNYSLEVGVNLGILF